MLIGGVPIQAWLLIFLAIGVAVVVLAAVLVTTFVVQAILATPAQLEVASAPEPNSPADLDDWLAAEEPLADFKVSKLPASTTSARADETAGRVTHGGPRE